MTEKMEKFFAKHDIEPLQIKYILREEAKTCICLMDGRKVMTYLTLREVLLSLPKEDFISVNRAYVLARRQIADITGARYTMRDGRVFDGRKNHAEQHRQNQKGLKTVIYPEKWNEEERLVAKMHIVDEMPIAFCIIELRFDQQGKGIDFIFRYCNRAMEQLEGKTLEQMLNHSFYDIFANADKKWLVAYADVALNGGKRTIYDYSSEVNKDLEIYCFQPQEGYCACLLLERQKDHRNEKV